MNIFLNHECGINTKKHISYERHESCTSLAAFVLPSLRKLGDLCSHDVVHSVLYTKPDLVIQSVSVVMMLYILFSVL